MNVLIIEDEARAANQLQQLMKVAGYDFKILDILDSIESSISWMQTNDAPELIFMDIQLADGLSFEIFKAVEIEAPIIFTTAFDQYAIQAFKVNSVDYLLKPIQQKDLEYAIQKYLKSKSSLSIDKLALSQLISTFQKPSVRNGFLVKKGSGYVHLKVEDLQYVYSEESITFGVTTKERYILDDSLDTVFSTLDTSDFFKINRGQIVRKGAILRIEPYFNHRLKIAVDHARDQEFIVSRSKCNDFKKWMNA